MSDDAALLHGSLLAKLRLDTNGRPIKSGSGLECAFEVRCSWSPVVDSPEARGNDYALIFVNANINVQSTAGDDCTEYEQRYEPTIIAIPHLCIQWIKI